MGEIHSIKSDYFLIILSKEKKTWLSIYTVTGWNMKRNFSLNLLMRFCRY